MLEKGAAYIEHEGDLIKTTPELKELVMPHINSGIEPDWIIPRARAYIEGDLSYEYLFKTIPYATIMYGGPDYLKQVVYSEEGLQYALSRCPDWALPKVIKH